MYYSCDEIMATLYSIDKNEIFYAGSGLIWWMFQKFGYLECKEG